MNQVRRDFSPRVLAVRRGEVVRFENLDSVFHNVFSLDKRNPFDLGLYKGLKRFAEDGRTVLGDGSAPAQKFAAEGKFLVFCNIHPDMVGVIHVIPHGYFAQADKDGLFDLPAPATGTVTLLADGPRLSQPASLAVDLGSAPALLEFPLRLKRLTVKPPHSRKDGRDYGGYGGVR